MTRSGRLRMILTVLALLVLAVPASADGFVPVLETEQVYFRCTGSNRVSQADLAQYIGWTTEPPAASVAEGGGCASHDSQACCGGSVSNDNYIYDAVFSGEMDGNLDSLTVKAWMVDVGLSRSASATIDIYLAVDGRIVLDNVRTQFALAATEPARAVEFTVTGLNLLSEADDTYHLIDLVMKTPTYSGTDISWVFDATEVPSGITFNSAEPAETQIAAR